MDPTRIATPPDPMRQLVPVPRPEQGGPPIITGPDGRQYQELGKLAGCPVCGLFHVGGEHHVHEQPSAFAPCACGYQAPLRFTLGDSPTGRVMKTIATGTREPPEYLRHHLTACERRAIELAGTLALEDGPAGATLQHRAKKKRRRAR